MEITESEITCTCAFLRWGAMGMSRRVSNTSVGVVGRLSGASAARLYQPSLGERG